MLKIKRGIIASCQPRIGGYMECCTWRLAAEAIVGGAVAVRIEGIENIKRVHEFTDVPIIGLVKVRECGETKITPTFDHAQKAMDAGADYIATDFTGRWGYGEALKMIDFGIPVVGDVAAPEDAKIAEEAGCVAVTTALCGYVAPNIATDFDPPDVKSVRLAAEIIDMPVIAEGRYFTVDDVMQAYLAGAHSVCVGAAITLPEKITKKLAEVNPWCV